jgi:hypothetical protein
MALGAAGRCIVRHGAQVFCLQGFSALSGEVGDRPFSPPKDMTVREAHLGLPAGVQCGNSRAFRWTWGVNRATNS